MDFSVKVGFYLKTNLKKVLLIENRRSAKIVRREVNFVKELREVCSGENDSERIRSAANRVSGRDRNICELLPK